MGKALVTKSTKIFTDIYNINDKLDTLVKITIKAIENLNINLNITELSITHSNKDL